MILKMAKMVEECRNERIKSSRLYGWFWYELRQYEGARESVS